MRVRAPGKAAAMSTAMTKRSTARISREPKLNLENMCGPPATQRVIEPTVVGIVPPRLTLSPSSVAPSGTDTAPPTPPPSPSTLPPPAASPADRDGLVDGLVGTDVERSTEHHALGAVTAAPLTPS